MPKDSFTTIIALIGAFLAVLSAIGQYIQIWLMLRGLKMNNEIQQATPFNISSLKKRMRFILILIILSLTLIGISFVTGFKHNYNTEIINTNNNANWYWLGHDLMRTIFFVQNNGSKKDILSLLGNSIDHVKQLGLQDNSYEKKLSIFRDKISIIPETQLTASKRDALSRELEIIMRNLGEYGVKNNFHWTSGQPEGDILPLEEIINKPNARFTNSGSSRLTR